jgi:hypothetical protein
MKTITSVLVVVLACAGGYGCTGLQRFIHGDPVVSGAPEINDNVFLLRHHGVDEETYTDTGKVVPYPCLPFMHNALGEKKDDKNDFHDPELLTDKTQIKLCVGAMHSLIDVRWHRFEHEVSAALSTSNFVADVSVLGLTTAATLASVDSAKILAAIAAGITGTRKSWDEDVLYSYSIQQILLQMRTDRALADSQIQARLASGGYDNIYEATNDLFNYDVAGSWEHAMSSLQLNVAATTAACQARLRNQEMASAAGSQPMVPVASTATDPCNSAQVKLPISKDDTSPISKDDIKTGAIFWMKDKSTIMIVDAGKSSGKPSYKIMQPDGTWSKDATSSDIDSLVSQLIFMLQPGSS